MTDRYTVLVNTLFNAIQTIMLTTSLQNLSCVETVDSSIPYQPVKVDTSTTCSRQYRNSTLLIAKCGQLPNPANGSVSPSLKTLNAANAYRVTCDKNYHIIGYQALWKNIICGPTGDWNGNMYSCESKRYCRK